MHFCRASGTQACQLPALHLPPRGAFCCLSCSSCFFKKAALSRSRLRASAAARCSRAAAARSRSSAASSITSFSSCKQEAEGSRTAVWVGSWEDLEATSCSSCRATGHYYAVLQTSTGFAATGAREIRAGRPRVSPSSPCAAQQKARAPLSSPAAAAPPPPPPPWLRAAHPPRRAAPALSPCRHAPARLREGR